MAAYDSFEEDKKVAGLKGEDVIDNAAWRIYTEWCMGEGKKKDHWNYDGAAFREWIIQETHFAMERLGILWDNETDSFVGENTEITYQKTRSKVHEAVMRRAVELFSEWENNQWPREGDDRNLRVSLEPYLDEAPQG